MSIIAYGMDFYQESMQKGVQRDREESSILVSPIKSSKQIADLALEVIPLALGVDPNYKRNKGR